MAALAPFLADIGASELSPHVKQGAPKIQQLQERILQEIQHTDASIQALVEGHKEEFEAQDTRTEKLEKQLEQVRAETGQAKSELEQEKQGLRGVLQEHAASHDAALHAQALQEATNRLHDVHLSLQQTASALGAGELDLAIQRLPQVLAAQTLWYTQTSHWTSLLDWQEDLQAQLGSRVQEAASQAIHVDVEKRSLTLTSDTSALEALWNDLKHLSLLDSHIKQLVTTLDKHFVQLYLQQSPSLSFVSAEGASMALQDTPETQPLDTLSTFLSFLQTHLPQVSAMLAPQIFGALQKHLDSSLPSTTEGLAPFQSRLQRAQALEADFLATSTIRSWSDQLPIRWVQKVNERVAAACRALVLQPGAKGWDSVEVEFEPVETFAPVASSSTAPQSIPDQPVPAPAPAPSPSRQPALLHPPPGKSHHRKTYSTVSVAADDDGWGFGESEDPAEEEPPDQSSAHREDDGWGFDEEEEEEEEEAPVNVAAAKPATKLMKGKKAAVRQPSPTLPPVQHMQEDDGWGFDDASPVIPQEPAPAPEPSVVDQTPTKVKFSVSAHSQQLVELAKSVLNLISETKSSQFALPHALSDIQPRLLQTFLDVFDFFRATMPLGQKQIITSVPALGMQYANDCDWLAGQLLDMHRSPSVLEAQSVDSFNATFEALRRFASAERRRQMDLQWAALDESLVDMKELQDVADATVFATCERATRQINHTLDRLAHVWRPVMDQKTYFTSMGTLVNRVLEHLIEEILGQVDIGEQESQNLSTLCKSLHSLQNIFADGDRVLVGPFVPLWFKLLYLSEILEGSMVDIMYLFDEGTLVDFSKDEMIRLVRALFSESTTRQRNIERIRQAPE